MGAVLLTPTVSATQFRAAAGASAEGAPVAPDLTGSVEPPQGHLSFDGYTWLVKSSTSPIGPGPNLFDASGPSVDKSGGLDLRILKTTLGWESSEVILKPSLGYGTYMWTLRGPVATLDPNVVLALFTYDSSNTTPSNREIDFEASRFANTHAANGQYVVQPYTTSGNMREFSIPRAVLTKVIMTWKRGSVAFSGNTVRDAKTVPLPSWKNTSSSVPDHGAEQIHMSLWLFQGVPPSNGMPVTVTVTSFAFRPAT
jgi:hypothetical protein